jgi:RNA polymerase sigma factor (sigma-70 family)
VTVPRQAEPTELTLTEAEIVKLAQQGDATAFERIYRLHNRRIYALCLRMAGNSTQAEDLTQDVFLQLFRKIGTFRGESAFSTWLHRMSVNIVLMRFRKKPKTETSLESITKPEDESGRPPEEFGGLTGVSMESLIASLRRRLSRDWLPDTERCLFSTTFKDISTPKLPRCSGARRETQNRRLTRLEFSCANRCREPLETALTVEVTLPAARLRWTSWNTS